MYNEKEEVRKQIKIINEVNKEVCRSKKSATEFLIKVGILTKSGNLSKRYYSKDEISKNKSAKKRSKRKKAL